MIWTINLPMARRLRYDLSYDPMVFDFMRPP